MPERRISSLEGKIRAFTWMTALLFLISISTAVGGYIANEHRIRENSTARTALCVLRANFISQIYDAAVFLKKHPNGVGGITRADIELGMKRQQSTVRSLHTLDCT